MARRSYSRDAAKERFWRRLVSGQRRSGLTIRDFCSEHRLSEPSFYAWRRELKRRDQERHGSDQPIGKRVRQQPNRSRHSRSLRSGTKAASLFLPVQVTADAAAAGNVAGGGHGGIDIVLGNGRRLRVGRGFDAQTLLTLIGVLESVAC